MRPVTALSDGPLNLLQAVQVALSPEARGHGALVVMDGQIHAAEWVTKLVTQGVGAFASPGRGPLGWVDDVGIHLPTASGPRQVPFADLALPEQWPQVPVVYGCVELEPLLLRANRCGSGPVHSDSDDQRFGLLPASSLNPQKARVLLLASIAGWDAVALAALMSQRQIAH